MLTLPSWQSLDLTVNFFSMKYQRHCAGCPCLPEQMNIQMCSMDELPCYTGDEQNMYRLVESDIEKSDGLTKHKEVKYVGLGYNEMKETLDCSIAPNSVHSRNRTEKMTPASALNIGGSVFSGFQTTFGIRAQVGGSLFWVPNNSGLVQPRSSVLEYNHQQPSCTNKPLEEVVSCSRVAETFQGNIFPRGKSCNNELVSPAGRDMPNMKVCSKDEVLIKDPVVLSNVEVVDLSTPESGCRTSLQTKKRRTDDSKFIDLTKSPIFV
ncbi:hypothetical protein POM88_047514 [Heracleum sosnowskyi]|uniref:Uncharacterized protein n=1 Tax=Heracleum sosnowskyi TaxID=360622 RepID=A0AAD8LZL0_9APIA|nr:hypothetical protein POM88_047514 [Heracleum sosnowskyi]